MASYKLTRKAVQDLNQIWNYTFDTWSENQADKYYIELINQCAKVAKDPLVGKQYEFLIAGLKGSKVNKHIIFYRQISDEEIEVERILHERMDLKSKFSNE